MTIDEALKIIKQSKECLIVWGSDTGEIINVKNLDEKVTPETFFEHLSAKTKNIFLEKTDTNIQFISQFRSSDKIDKDYLEKEQEDFLRLNLRVKILNQWTYQSIDELILILETRHFPFPTTEGDTYILLERLFDFQWQEIGKSELERLWVLIENDALTEKNRILLRFHLLFFEKRKDEFIKYYKKIFENPFYWISNRIDDYIGDLQIADENILKNYHEILNHPKVLFGARYPTMISLGKIGNAAGEKSAQIIEEIIFDSTETIIKARTAVLKRIRTPDKNWDRCPNCIFGKIKGNYGEMLTMSGCDECVGLGWIEF